VVSLYCTRDQRGPVLPFTRFMDLAYRHLVLRLGRGSACL